MNSISKYRHKKWEIRAAGFIFAALLFACFVDSDGIVGTVTMAGAVVSAMLAGGCELLASRWS